jgi:hypothetical protein
MLGEGKSDAEQFRHGRGQGKDGGMKIHTEYFLFTMTILIVSFCAGYWDGWANGVKIVDVPAVLIVKPQGIFQFRTDPNIEGLKPIKTNAPAVAYGPNKMIAGWIVREQAWKMLK